jgi:predicted ester cyclase
MRWGRVGYWLKKVEGVGKSKKLYASAAFPEKRFVVEDLIAEGDKVALRVTIHGVPTVPGEPLPIIMEIFRIENGRVAEVWGTGTLRRPDA